MNLTQLEAFGRYIEQPQVIRNVGKKALLGGSIAGVGLLTGADTYNAQPQDRQKVLIRDGLVLGATLAGTALATHKLMPLPTKQDMEDSVGFIKGRLGTLLKEHQGLYSEDKFKPLHTTLAKLDGKLKLERKDFETILETIKKNTDEKTAKKHISQIFEAEEKEIENENFFERVWRKMKQEAKPKEGIEEGEGRKMVNFFSVGGLSVISGLLGGIAANKINGVKDPDATVNMIKEGIFQFVANIALCAVGASAAIIAMSPKKVEAWLEKQGMKGKLLKTAGIGAGLSLGIFGGGVIANKLGTKVINPICDKIQGKEPQPETDSNQGKRKIEFWDAILHLDDVPTAMALAGMEIVEPFIPLFFGFSGYRTGIGYRNDDAAKAGKGKTAPVAFSQAEQSKPTAAPVITPQLPPAVSFNPMSEQLKAQNNPFGPAMQAPWQLPSVQPQSFETMPHAAPAA